MSTDLNEPAGPSIAEGTHNCMADGCGATIPAVMAFCRAHYRLVPFSLRDKLGTAFRRWQQGHPGSVEQLRAVQEECREAIRAKTK